METITTFPGLEGNGTRQQPKRRPKTSNSVLLARRRPSLPAVACKDESLKDLDSVIAREGREIVEALLEISAGPIPTQPVRPKSVSSFRQGSILSNSLSNMAIEFPSKERIESWKNASQAIKKDDLRQWNSEQPPIRVETADLKIVVETKSGTPKSEENAEFLTPTHPRTSEQKRPTSRTAFTLSSVQLVADPDWNSHFSSSYAHAGSGNSAESSKR